MMQVVVFKADVRALDPQLRWLNAQCRRSLTEDECKTVADVVLLNCRFSPDWDSVPEDAVRIVPTKKAEKTIIEKYLSSKQTTNFVAIDEVLNGTVWAKAGDRITKRLNRDCYEYDNCRIYLHAIVRMTYNEHRNATQFSQGQLAVVVELPNPNVVFLNQRLRLRIAPPGVHGIDPNNIPNNFPEILIGPRLGNPIVVGPSFQLGRRTQYPIRYHLASTIHRIQGETVPLYATEMSDCRQDYKLWQKEQFAVLISRAQHCADIIFVGNREETRNAMIQILGRTSKWDLLIDEYLSNLDVTTRPAVREINWAVHPYRPQDRELPTAACGYVYMIISLAHPNECYVGQCENLKTCLRQHNTGHGNEITRSTALHPWGVYAFVCGFEDSTTLASGIVRRGYFYDDWLHGISFSEGPDLIYARGLELIAEETRQNPATTVVIVKCGSLR
jgi:hypothetical protein